MMITLISSVMSAGAIQFQISNGIQIWHIYATHFACVNWALCLADSSKWVDQLVDSISHLYNYATFARSGCSKPCFFLHIIRAFPPNERCDECNGPSKPRVASQRIGRQSSFFVPSDECLDYTGTCRAKRCRVKTSQIALMVHKTRSCGLTPHLTLRAPLKSNTTNKELKACH